MRLRVALLSFVVATLLVLAPYTIAFTPWQFDPESYPQIAKWAGCKAQVVVMDDRPAVTSYYVFNDENQYLVIGTLEMGDIPYYAGLIVVLHETGHCLQQQQGTLFTMTQVERELDADRYSADLACALGLDGRKLLRDTFIWARDTFGYNGDPGHGTLAERIGQGANARMCDKKVES